MVFVAEPVFYGIEYFRWVGFVGSGDFDRFISDAGIIVHGGLV